MLLTDKVCVITGAASQRGIGRATARLFAEHGARSRSSISTTAAAQGSRRRSRARGISASPATSPTRQPAGTPRSGSSANSARSTSWSTMPASPSRSRLMDIDARRTTTRVLDVNLRGMLYMSQAVIPHMREQQLGLHRLHVVGLGAARRRHLRRPALHRGQGRRARPRQGHGARTRAGRHPGELDHARPDPDRHHRRQADRRDARRRSSRASRSAVSATPTTWPASTCSWPPTCPSYVTGAVIDVNGGMLIH